MATSHQTLKFYSFYSNYFFPVRRETWQSGSCFLKVSPKFIFSPDNWITFYIIQNSKTHWERSTHSEFNNAHNTIEFNISKEQTSASLIFGNHDSGLNCGLHLRLTKGHCWVDEGKEQIFSSKLSPSLKQYMSHHVIPNLPLSLIHQERLYMCTCTLYNV